MLITSHGHSDVGFVRENNEDSFLVDEGKGIYAVADGVGGLPFGALASRLAVRFFASFVHDGEICSTKEQLREIVHSVHQNVVECGSLVGGENGIGTTFSGLRIIGGRLIYGHVGDSSISGDSIMLVTPSEQSNITSPGDKEYSPKSTSKSISCPMHRVKVCM